MWWNRNPAAFWGGLLVILGVLFLLGNLNLNVRWDLVWPVFLVALGAWLILARIGPGGSIAEVDSTDARGELAKARLEVALGAGRLDVRSAALGDQLYRAHIEHAGSTPEIRLDRDTGTVRINTRFDWFGARRLRVEAQVTDAIPWEVSCSTGAIRGEFDLSTTSLTRFDCRTGASELNVSLPAPKGVVPMRVDGGALTVNISRPAGAAIKIESSGGAVHMRADGSRQDGIGKREWRSTGFEGATDRFEVSVSGGALNVFVSER